MSDPVILPPDVTILCVAESPESLECNTSYMWAPLVSAFGMPSVGGTSTAVICNSNHWAIGAYAWIEGLGFLLILGRVGVTGLALQNTGVVGNAIPGTVAPEANSIIQMGPPNAYAVMNPNETGQLIQRGQEQTLTMNLGVKDELLATVVYLTPYGGTVNPVVVLSVDKDDDMGELFSVYVRDADNLGFLIYGSNAFAGNEDVNVNWIAIG